jgi:hypothetical protein
MSKAKAKGPSKGGMPRFVPTDDERALVKLLIASGYAQHLVCKCISNRRGSHIGESTLKRAFAHELEERRVLDERIAADPLDGIGNLC